jgi:hypothetical protein
MMVCDGMDLYIRVSLTSALAVGECSASLSLYPWGKSSRCPSGRRLSRPQSRSGQYGKVEILDPVVIQTLTPRLSGL